MTNTSKAFWEAHYSKLVKPSSGKPSKLLEHFTKGRIPARALDIGCSRGDDAIWLAKQGWQVTGVDISETALQAARDKTREVGLSGQTNFECHDLNTSFPEGEFDLISAMYLHSPAEYTFHRVATLQRAAASTASGGLLLIVAHGSRAPWSWADPEFKFPAAEEELKSLSLDDTRWKPLFVGPIERQAIGPNGETATVTDSVIALERI